MPTSLTLRSAGEVTWLPLPATWPAGIAGGVSTRLGGVSPEPWRAMNVGSRVGDLPWRVAENLGRLSVATHVALDAAARIPLEHGARVRVVEAAGLAEPGDALVTRRRNLPLVLTVADCYPLLLASGSQAVALAHCGWRGAVQGIARSTVQALRAAAGGDVRQMHAWIGPGIGSCCYTLPLHDALRFPQAHRSRPTGPASDRAAVDIAGFLFDELHEVGLTSAQIGFAGVCTACHPELFFSHRRDNGKTGRMLAWIILGGDAG